MNTEQILNENKITPKMLEEIRDRTIEELRATFDLFINEAQTKKEGDDE